MPAAIRVVLAEDHQAVRAGTRSMLETDSEIEVVGDAGDGQSALDLVASLAPDVLVVDIHLSRVTGIEVARRLTRSKLATRVIALSSDHSDEYVAAAIEAGVAAYLPVTARAAELVNAVHSVARGNVSVQHSASSLFSAQAVGPGESRSSQRHLTGREVEIVRLAGLGMRNRQIAEDLHLSERTVEAHLSRAFAKLKVSSRTQALLQAVAQGWLAVPTGL